MIKQIVYKQSIKIKFTNLKMRISKILKIILMESLPLTKVFKFLYQLNNVGHYNNCDVKYKINKVNSCHEFGIDIHDVTFHKDILTEMFDRTTGEIKTIN